MMTYDEKKDYLKGYKIAAAVLMRLESRKKFFALSPAEEAQLKKAALRLQKIAEEINLVSSPLSRELLTGRYIGGASLNSLGEHLGYSSRHIQRLHKAAVNEFEVL